MATQRLLTATKREDTTQSWEVFRFEGLRRDVIGCVFASSVEDALRIARRNYPDHRDLIVKQDEDPYFLGDESITKNEGDYGPRTDRSN
jgi:hypothetical protein